VQLFQPPDWSCEMAKDNDDEASNPGSQEEDNKKVCDEDDADDDNDEEGDDEDVSDVSNEDDSLTEGEENGEHLYTLDHYDEENLPEYSCRYCGIHDPACVAKCVETKKWFCNAAIGSGGSHLVHHLVRSRSNQVQLHPESPLGDTVLECYNCASKNAFVLGFVPASSSSVVVLLCRVCVETVPALKDMDWELAQWHPLIQDRKFLPWLIKVGRGMLPDVIYYLAFVISIHFVLGALG
jgi:regulator of nonsense transcripts 1